MEKEIKLILSEISENPQLLTSINSNTNILTDVGLDSLKMINFILKVEEELNVYIDFDKFNCSHLSSVKEFAKFVEQCKKCTPVQSIKSLYP